MATNSKLSSSALPYELLLIAIEYLISGIEKRQGGEMALIHYRHEVNCKLAVSDDNAKGHFAKAMKKRYRDLRLPLHLNQQSRKMAHQAFRPVPMFYHNNFNGAVLGPMLRVSALILPGVDAFIPFGPHNEPRQLGDGPDGVDREAWYHQTVHLPSPESHDVLSLIQTIYLPRFFLLGSRRPTVPEALLALPNLKSIMVNIGQIEVAEDLFRGRFHNGLRRLSSEYRFFPQLRLWSDDRNFPTIWSKFQRKGVKLYGMIGNTHLRHLCFIEVFPSKNGIKIQYVNANCTCCPALPTSARRKMGAEVRADLFLAARREARRQGTTTTASEMDEEI